MISEKKIEKFTWVLNLIYTAKFNKYFVWKKFSTSSSSTNSPFIILVHVSAYHGQLIIISVDGNSH